MKATLDWPHIIQQALRKLGGDKIAVPGAKLRDEAEKLAGENLGPYLESGGQTFSQLLAQIPGIEQYKRRGTDMAVGFKGAAVPVPPVTSYAEAQEVPLRQDVYAALTQVSPRPYVYIPSADEFTNDPPSDPDAVELPGATLQELIAERREFGKGVEDAEQQTRLIAAIERSPNPLWDFRRVVSELRLGRSWYVFKLQRLREKLERWAKESNVQVRPSWFAQRAEPGDAPQDVLAHLARYMSDEEIRGLMVPFRAVEAWYRAAGRRRRP
jgi:hypothetical protein